ncbi:alpha/beta hydrolase [Streptosporangium carneum]|uniref:Peptidase S33 tripeptidyl aminopeptidase-like C-terminal domain-containing protein n=1 Tax=Streptosporangium carneum TaxID=47481 RepID=A0A9W6ID21_9ACTN|nr:alpha/beta hydrolase [Streptosporangium carneum]GLK15473.1 hypothetical protein GCM10017600_88860 [Streptosporangium carneum]
MAGLVRVLGAVLAGTALALAPVSEGGTAWAGGGPAIGWAPCEENRAAECGTLRVPIDWARPDGATFGLAVARHRATEPARRIGVLVVNPGGPGAGFVQAEAKTYFSEEILARFDIVGFDPRGSGGSAAVRCSADIVRREPLPAPRDQADFDRLVAYNAELAADCRRRTGPLADHLDTVSVARDLDALRAALGERTLSYHGVSAGTLLGQQYAELFGRNIRAMSLDSTVDHSLSTGRLLVGQAANVEAAFGAFTRWCDRDPTCALHGRNVTRIWDGLMTRADRGTLRDPSLPGRVLNDFDLATEAHLGAFMEPSYDWLAKRLASLESGGPGPRGVVRGYPGPEIREIEHPAPAACQDWKLRIPDYRRFAVYAERMRRAAPHMRTQPDRQAFVLSCALWPGTPTNPQHRLTVERGTPAILLINGRYDPAAGHRGAANVRRQLGRGAALVTYEGPGHGVYHRTACTRQAVDDYLLRLRLPADGSSCAPASPAGARTAPASPAPARPSSHGEPPGLAGISGGDGRISDDVHARQAGVPSLLGEPAAAGADRTSGKARGRIRGEVRLGQGSRHLGAETAAAVLPEGALRLHAAPGEAVVPLQRGVARRAAERLGPKLLKLRRAATQLISGYGGGVPGPQ